VTCVSFGADWPPYAGQNQNNQGEAVALARFLKTAVAEARLPWVDWNLYCQDAALKRQLNAMLSEMDEICRQRGQPIRLDPAQSIAGGLNPDFSFERFVVGEGYALASARGVLAAIGAPTHNIPLWIFGDCGLGKTHLLHAVGWKYLAVNPDRRILLLHGTELAEPAKCITKIKAADALLIDDIQCLVATPDASDWLELLASLPLLAVSAEKLTRQTAIRECCEGLPAWIEVPLVTPGPELASALLDSFQNDARHALTPELRRSVLATANGNPRLLQAMVKKIVAYEVYEHRKVDSVMLANWFAG
jgi:chromosomal replication initiation ATPase DnaA